MREPYQLLIGFGHGQRVGDIVQHFGCNDSCYGRITSVDGDTVYCRPLSRFEHARLRVWLLVWGLVDRVRALWPRRKSRLVCTDVDAESRTVTLEHH